MKKRLRFGIFGKVQNVGFRYECRAKAGQLGILGWAKNMADGHIELEVEGDEHRLKDFLEWCQHRAPGKVERVESKWLDNKDEFRSFIAD